jgi:hypothetical protein
MSLLSDDLKIGCVATWTAVLVVGAVRTDTGQHATTAGRGHPK